MWLEEQPFKITKEIIHLITGYPIYDHARAQKMISQKELISLTRVELDCRGLKLNNVTDAELKFAIRVIGYCFFQLARENSVPCAAVNLAYKIVNKGMKIDLCEVLLKNLFENLNTIRKLKRNNSANTLKFGSLLVCMFFYFEKLSPSVSKVVWELHRPITHQINNFIKKLGDNFNDIMDDYFSKFQEKMHNRYQIPPKLVEKYKDDICFEVDTYCCYVNVVEPRT